MKKRKEQKPTTRLLKTKANERFSRMKSVQYNVEELKC